MKRITLLLFCICLILLSSCAAPAEEKEADTVSIWYIAGDAMEQPLKARCRQIQAENDNIIIELYPFESMARLSEMLQGKRPDLLLCSHELAFSLDEQGMLKSLDMSDLNYRPELVSDYPGFGKSFFPIGASVELLCSREELPETALSSFEALCYELEENEKLMTVDSLARLMSNALIQREGKLSAERSENAANPDYVYIHNLLAEKALQGTLSVFDQGGKELITQGRVDAAIISSAGLTDLPENVKVTPVPTMEGGSKSIMADMRGFAYLGNTRNNSRATAFVLKKLLADGEAKELALECGLVSAQMWQAGDFSSGVERALHEIYSDWEMVLPSPVSPYVTARQQLEEDLSAAFEFLQ